MPAHITVGITAATFILIDNYDSFTWNLWHFLSDLGPEADVMLNDAARVDEIMSRAPQGLILSPGPGMPQTTGISIDLIRVAAGKIPVLGVCLGHQALAGAFGGSLLRVDPPVHGKLSKIVRTNINAIRTDLFADCPHDFPVTRYHSRIVDEVTLPDCLTVTARTEAGAIMALSHMTYDLYGVQFHPESIASVAGYRILAAFLTACGHNTPTQSAIALLEEQVLRLDERFPGHIHP